MNGFVPSIVEEKSQVKNAARSPVCSFVLFLFFALAASAQTPKPSTAGGNAQNGKQLFTSRKCFSCHGPDAMGGIGPSLVPPGRVLTDFVKYVRQPLGQMLPFTTAEVPDRDLLDIYAFLQASAPSSPVLSASNGNLENGRRIFVSYGCFECHGREGQGSAATGGARLGPPALSFPAFAAYVRHPTLNMPPYAAKAVKDAELADIYVFLQSIPVGLKARDIPLLNP